ncbi:predicted protein [Histoplasma mississippiense (nom. inval.)]|uniref:predicted protein n=1 Tax=Ajellomyces capsulatus (strain NAm1 / WU24) TaxID=2059318 RepID=UPI000157C8E7|nr:predicted protein [Histoplasma mississippiense (nom. inval.)]EDN08988.1 predicted protein [Histoplasma mississippiense (nom. inval.)]
MDAGEFVTNRPLSKVVFIETMYYELTSYKYQSLKLSLLFDHGKQEGQGQEVVPSSGQRDENSNHGDAYFSMTRGRKEKEKEKAIRLEHRFPECGIFWEPDPTASEVYVTGTFDNWSRSVKLERSTNGFRKDVEVPSIGGKILYKVCVCGYIYDIYSTCTLGGGGDSLKA